MQSNLFVVCCLLIYLVLKHSFQSLVKDLERNENKNIKKDINYKYDKYFDVVNDDLSVGWDLIPYPISGCEFKLKHQDNEQKCVLTFFFMSLCILSLKI